MEKLATNDITCPVCKEVIMKLIADIDPAIIQLLAYHLLKECKSENGTIS